MEWNRFHLLLAGTYLAGLLLVGVLAGRKKRDSNQYLNASGALPLWVCIVACIAANCGSLDVVAMMALGAQYGMLACHFYWLGAVPALLVVAFWLLPAYAKGHNPTVLEFVADAYGEKTRLLVSVCMAAMMLLLSGVCLCALAQVLVTFLGWSFFAGVMVVVPVVLFYSWEGGFRATVYTELLHFAIVLVAIVPLCFLMIHDFGGVTALLARIPAARFHLWQSLPAVAPGAVMDRLGLIAGLGLVLSFGFWGTDFVQMQRALAVRRKQDVAYVSLGMAAAKLVFAFLIVLPGVAAPLVLGGRGGSNWNATLPTLILHYYSPAWVVIGVMGLVASLVSTFSNNVAGFSSAWVQGVYQPWIRPEASEAHYVRVSRLTNAAAIALSIGAAYMALSYESLMEYMQMIFSTFNAPLFALVGLAFVAPRRVRGGGVGGFCLGLGSAALHQVLVHAGLLHYGSQMSANFYAAMVGFSVAAVGTLALGGRQPEVATEAVMEEGGEAVVLPKRFPLPAVLMAIGIATVCIWLNVFFW